MEESQTGMSTNKKIFIGVGITLVIIIIIIICVLVYFYMKPALWINKNAETYAAAVKSCKDKNSEIADESMVKKAHEKGHINCSPTWIKGTKQAKVCKKDVEIKVVPGTTKFPSYCYGKVPSGTETAARWLY